jgi:phosphoserine phosphatase RsbU/P
VTIFGRTIDFADDVLYIYMVIDLPTLLKKFKWIPQRRKCEVREEDAMAKVNRAHQFKQECIGLYSELNLGALLDKLADKVCVYLGCEEASIFLYDSVREELYFEIATGKKKEELKKIVMKKGEGLVGWVAVHNKSVIVNDCSKDQRFTAVTDIKTKFRTQSLLAVPVRRANNFLGVLEAVNKINDGFDEKDKNTLESIANFVSIPLQNALLFRKVTSEVNEKERLIELGKIVSHSFDLDEVFRSLRDAITEVIDPLEINVMVKSQEKTHQLIPQTKTPYVETDIEQTTINARQAVFPLRIQNNTLGYLEIKVKSRIPDKIISLIRGISIFAAISIEKFEMHSKLLERQKLEQELKIARKMQRSFLPGEDIQIDGLEVSCANISSSAVGGDYYDIKKISEDETVFTINDISGHGIPASLPMSIFSANFRYRLNRDKNMLVTIHHLNNLLAETTDLGQYVTSFTCCLDMNRMKLTYINAGHHYPMLFRGDGMEELSQGETVLGLFPDVQRSEIEVNLRKNDLLVMYTDGIIEAEDKKGKQFSKERFKKFIREHQQLDVESIKHKLIRALKDFIGGVQFDDDVTFIIIKIK